MTWYSKNSNTNQFGAQVPTTFRPDGKRELFEDFISFKLLEL